MFQSAMAITDEYEREVEKINTLRNLRKIHIDDEGKMVVNDDLYAPILYHTRDSRPRLQVKHSVQPPPTDTRAVPIISEQLKSDLVDSGNNSMTESTDTGQLDDILLFEDGRIEDYDNICNEDMNKVETNKDNIQTTVDDHVNPEYVGIFGNMKRMLASFFEAFDESDGDSATTEGINFQNKSEKLKLSVFSATFIME